MVIANALSMLAAIDPRPLEIHLIGHSAGSILLGHLVPELAARGLSIKSVHLYAPACTVAFANEYWLPRVGTAAGEFPPHVSMLDDKREHADASQILRPIDLILGAPAPTREFDFSKVP